MKAHKEFRSNSREDLFESSELKRGKKFNSDKKVKNEKKSLYEVDDFEEEYDLQKYKRESIADFYDDGSEDNVDDEEEGDEYEEDAEEADFDDSDELEDADLDEDYKEDRQKMPY